MCVPPVRMCQILQPISHLSWCLYIYNQSQYIRYCFLVLEPELVQTAKIMWHFQPYETSKLSENSMALAQNRFSRLSIPFAPIAYILIIITFQCFYCLFVLNVICSISLTLTSCLADRASIPCSLRLENKLSWTLRSCKSYLNTYIKKQVPTARTKTLLRIHANKVLNLSSTISGVLSDILREAVNSWGMQWCTFCSLCCEFMQLDYIWHLFQLEAYKWTFIRVSEEREVRKGRTHA